MKKLVYLIMLFAVFSSCKFDESSYSIIREFDSGTYITPDGKVKYISGSPDSLISVSDNNAVIQENITYVKKNSSGILSDSILIYGHVYSKSPNPVVCGYDSVSKIDLLARLVKNSNFYYNGTNQPESFITTDKLDRGITFQSGFGLHYETQYYVRSFVVTGKFVGGSPEYDDIAYNQSDLQFTTDKPVDLWVGGSMQDAPRNFPDDNYRGGTAFTYNGYMFVAQGHNQNFMQNTIQIYRYDPKENDWNGDVPFATLTILSQYNFTDAVSFVIKDVPFGNQIYHDCLYIGLGVTNDETEGNIEFYRFDFEDTSGNPWLKIASGLGEQLPISGLQDAVAFSINGYGYIGLGSTFATNHEPTELFFKFDPSDRGDGHAYGKWESTNNFRGGKRTKAVSFKIGENVYVGCGEDENGDYHNDIYMCYQTAGGNINWVKRAPFPGTPRIDAVAFTLGENGYIGTGLDADSARSDFWRYNPFINQWDQRAFYGGEPRYEAVGAGVKINDNDYRGYIGTGWNGTTYFSDFWHYRP